MLEVEVSDRGTWTVLDVHGDIDALTTPDLRKRLMRSTGADHPHVLVDLADVDFVDAIGLRALMDAHQQAETNDGDLAVVAPRGAVKRVIDLTGVDAVVRVYDSVDDVIDA